MYFHDQSAVEQVEENYRKFGFVLGIFVVTFIGSVAFRSSVADALDAILDLSESSRNAALLGWAAAFNIPIYGLIVSTFKNPVKVLWRTWPLITLLIIPTFAFAPSRSTTNGTEDIASKFYFLGSFFDTYYLGIFAYLSIVAAIALSVWLVPLPSLDPKVDLDPDVLALVEAYPDSHLFAKDEPGRFDQIKEWRAAGWVRRVIVRAVTAGWIIGVFIYALTF